MKRIMSCVLLVLSALHLIHGRKEEVHNHEESEPPNPDVRPAVGLLPPILAVYRTMVGVGQQVEAD